MAYLGGAVLLLVLAFWLVRAAYRFGKAMGRVEAIEDSKAQIAEAAEDAFGVGFRTALVSQEDNLGSDPHVVEQRKNAGNQ